MGNISISPDFLASSIYEDIQKVAAKIRETMITFLAQISPI